MSQYVKRCAECRVVRGLSSFRLLRGTGGRVETCRWCEAQAGTPWGVRNRVREIRALQREEKRLLAKRDRLQIRLDTVSRESAGRIMTQNQRAPPVFTHMEFLVVAIAELVATDYPAVVQ